VPEWAQPEVLVVFPFLPRWQRSVRRRIRGLSVGARNGRSAVGDIDVSDART
jgi:hypothetical protein